jgi:hypothetical protein
LQRLLKLSRRDRHAETQRKRDEAHLERLKEARGTVTDFDRVLQKMTGVNVRDELIDEIKESDKSALLTYHLASNPDKLAELNHMSDRERAREIGRLEATLKLPSGKKQTSAPPPPSTLRGAAGWIRMRSQGNSLSATPVPVPERVREFGIAYTPTLLLTCRRAGRGTADRRWRSFIARIPTLRKWKTS